MKRIFIIIFFLGLAACKKHYYPVYEMKSSKICFNASSLSILLDKNDIESINIITDKVGQKRLNLILTNKGTNKINHFLSKNIGNILSIYWNSHIIAQATIQNATGKNLAIALPFADTERYTDKMIDMINKF